MDGITNACMPAAAPPPQARGGRGARGGRNKPGGGARSTGIPKCSITSMPGVGRYKLEITCVRVAARASVVRRV